MASANSNNYKMKTKQRGLLTLFFALIMQISFAQNQSITGTVSDQDGLPLPGVNIVVKGTTNGTQTDFDGNYTISASEGQSLLFSYIGYKNETRAVEASSIINLQMTEDTEALEEVVVTALNISRKPRELAYSVASLDTKALTETKAVNAATAMVGKVSGMQINTINSGVNPSTRIVLRGSRSLQGNNQALIVIDGFPSARGVYDRISPNDIESTTVLKGSNASVLYGSEASNGVLLVTTKKGKGKMSVEYNTSTQFEQVSYLPELQDQYGAGGFPDGTLFPLENVAWGPKYDGQLVDGSETYEDGRVLQLPYSPIKNRNKDFFNTGITNRHGVILSGGDETSDFLLSIDQTNTTGTIPKDTYNRTNARIKGSREYGKLKIGGNATFFRDHQNVTSSSGGRQSRPFYWTLINTPLHIPLNGSVDGVDYSNWQTGEFTRNEVSFFRFYENPYFILDTQRDKQDIKEFNFLTNIDYQITDWLKASIVTGYTNSTTKFKKETGAFTYAFQVPDAYSNLDAYGATTTSFLFGTDRFNSDILLTFDKEFNDFSTKLTVGHNTRIETTDFVSVSGNDLIIPDFYNVSTRTGELIGSESTTEYRRMGVYADFTLGYKNYLFLNLIARNDWSSALNINDNSFFYPGAGLSFVATDAFPGLKSENGISYIKANFSITKTGNDPSAYQNNSTFTTPSNFPYANTVGLSQSSDAPDPFLGPEFTTSVEAGLEITVLKDRLSLIATTYKTNTVDQIIPVNVSLASGATTNVVNVGEIENKGLELDLKSTLVSTDNFSWKMNLNYTGFKSEVLELTEGVEEIEIGAVAAAGARVVARVGESFPLLRTTAYERDPQGRIVVGADGDPIQDTQEQTQGKTVPDYILGANTTIRYKNFRLYASADYRTGHVFYNSLYDALEFTGLTPHSVESGRQPFVFPNSSYADGNGGYTANATRLTSGGGNAFWDSYNEIKENYVTDATSLRLREVSLSYDFDSDFLDQLGLQELSLSLFGRNLVSWLPKENKITDPEFGNNTGNAVGIGTQQQGPPSRTLGASLTVKF